jgi:hypothetical protein
MIKAYILLVLSVLLNVQVKASEDTQRYCYPSEPNLTVIVAAPTWEDGKPAAARSCFKALTNGKYPGEERGLDIIDICANPRRCS